MKTLAFCSYGNNSAFSKTDMLLWCAKHLIAQGHKIVLADWNLPSPVLHARAVEEFGPIEQADQGTLDYLLLFQDISRVPGELKEFVEEVPRTSALLIPTAGVRHGEEYYEDFFALDYRKFFPEGSAEKAAVCYGVGLLLSFVKQVQDQLAADYLLMDTPTLLSDFGYAIAARVADASIWVPNTSVEAAGLQFALKRLSQERKHEHLVLNTDERVEHQLRKLLEELASQPK
jgi:hypothetical protein